MYKILLGILLAAVDFSIEIDYSVIGLLPDFVGYILIGRGLWELEEETAYFKEVQGSVRFIKILSFIMYVLNLSGVVSWVLYNNILVPVTAIIMLAINLVRIGFFAYITYYITSGIQEMEDKYDMDMNGERMMTSWKWMMATQGLKYCCAIFEPYIPGLAWITAVAVLITLVIYLFHFVRGIRQYKSC